MANSSESAVVAIVATYRPSPAVIETVADLMAHFAGVVVVDDGSPAGYEATLAKVAQHGATVIKQPHNSGIAAALNRGMAAAAALGSPEFFVTFDQDSRPVANYADNALETYRQARSAGVKVGLVVASSYAGRPCRVRRDEGGFAVALDPMQSGFVIPRATWEAVGEFDESLVIDGVDSDFTARVNRLGLHAVVGRGCGLDHALGRRDAALLFGHELRVRGQAVTYNYHSPTRVYYITRNGTLLTARYWRSDPGWVGRRLLEESKAHLMRVALSPLRVRYLAAMAAGWRDAFRGRLGPIPSPLQRRLERTN